ncbi:MAG: hypothetical protein Q8O89_04745 [Nanoarchaeota archaeon]|nr:hypothetical protein [Nanoarchaeota archaeon]
MTRKETGKGLWRVSFIELKNKTKRYKVTRRIPHLGINETRMFSNKEEALNQFWEWSD